MDIQSDRLPTQSFLKSLFRYDEITGFLYRDRQRAGARKQPGYRVVVISGRQYYEHRIIWKMINGTIPKGRCIDHIDRNKSNNKINNLRLVTPRENSMNRNYFNGWSHNTSSKTGVHLHCQGGRCKWWARITIKGKRMSLGVFDSFSDAVEKRVEFENKYFYNK